MRNLQCSLVYVEFYEEFNGASCQIFLLRQKKVMSKNKKASIFVQNQFFTDSVLSVRVLKWQSLLKIV